MPNGTHAIAAKVRGLAAENRFTQQDIADVLGVSRGTVIERLQGRISFSAAEILALAQQWNEPIARFFPDPFRHADVAALMTDAARSPQPKVGAA